MIGIGMITGGEETAYRRELEELVAWCHNNVSLKADKTKEMIKSQKGPAEAVLPKKEG